MLRTLFLLEMVLTDGPGAIFFRVPDNANSKKKIRRLNKSIMIFLWLTAG